MFNAGSIPFIHHNLSMWSDTTLNSVSIDSIDSLFLIDTVMLLIDAVVLIGTGAVDRIDRCGVDISLFY